MSTDVLTPRKQRQRRVIFWAIAASLLLHLILIISIASVSAFRPTPDEPPVPEETPVEFTLVEPPPPQPSRDPSYVETTDAQRSEKPPERPVFESDKDTEAASSLPATGTAPLPTQEGEQSPAMEFENRQYTAGQQPKPSAPPPAPQQEAVTPPEEVSAKPQPTPRNTVPLALLEPPPKETPKPEQKPKPTPPPPSQPQPRSNPSSPGFQPQTRITRIQGNISNRGRSAVAAAATPLGRYKKMLSDAIGSRWYYYVNEQLGLLNIGTLEVVFTVKENGKVEGIRVIRNSSNESFASCSVRAIMEAEIPPIPKEIVPMLEKGRIEIEYSFTILSN